MSPLLQQAFMDKVYPVICATVPRIIRPIGAEDPQELVQDALAMACRDAEALERNGKTAQLKNIAYFTIQRMKNGRRSTGDHRTDVMSPGCRVDGRADVVSMDTPLVDDQDDQELCLNDLLSAPQDDPATLAVRNLDWTEFTGGLEPIQRQVLRDTAVGYSTGEQAVRQGITAPAVVCRKRVVARRARAFWGESVLTDAADTPLWRKTRRWR